MLLTTQGIEGSPPVSVTYEVGSGKWRLLTDYRARDERMDCTLIIRGGFEFDLASIPRILWGKVGPHELSILAPLCHDALYRHGGQSGEYLTLVPSEREYTRRDADKLFANQMGAEGVPWWRVKLAYRAVRWFGGKSFKAAA